MNKKEKMRILKEGMEKLSEPGREHIKKIAQILLRYQDGHEPSGPGGRVPPAPCLGRKGRP
jgi:hypothetical protein